MMDSEGNAAGAQADRAATPTASARTSPTASGSARAWSASARWRRRRILLTDVPADYIQISSGLGEAHAAQHHRPAVLFEGEVKAVIELASLPPVQRHPPDLPRPAHGEHRRRAEHDRRQHAHRGAAAAVAEPHPGAAEPVEGAHRSSRTSSSAPTPSWRSRRSSWRRRPSCSRSRTRKVEEKNREVEQARARLEEKAEQLALISKYKSEFLANMSPRAAHAAQQPAHPREAARGQQGRQPHRQAGRVRARRSTPRAATCSR